ncbi:MAG: HAMP domain-containing sensor histidine kinase [Chloroflexota bacterium]
MSPRPLRLRDTLRWRLSAGFGGMALLTAALVGVVLLPMLGSQYARSDETYLSALADRAASTLAAADWTSRPALDAVAQDLATGLRVHVVLYSPDGALVADVARPAGAPDTGAASLPTVPGIVDEAVVSTLDHGATRNVLRKGGALLGTVEISEVSAYGAAALAAVARSWAFASLLAVALAALAGILLARRLSRPLTALGAATERMAAGDLGARAGLDGSDEIGRLASSFDGMADQVETTVASLRRFVADAAHEIGTPLTALRADLDLASLHARDEDEVRLLERAGAQAGRLESLRTGLLALSRLESSAAPADERCDLALAARQVVALAASRADQADVALTADLPAGPAWVAGDQVRLTGAVTNLVDNALKFTPAGGRVMVGLRAWTGTVHLWVEDTGIGIPAEDLPGLFGRFHRARNANDHPGSGLGLAIVRAAVERSGGTVTVRSEPGIGSRFEVVLPATTDPARSDAP